MVVNTSVVLAILFAEPQAESAAEQLDRNADDLRMSTVKLTEVLIRIRGRQPQLASEVGNRVLASGIRLAPVDVAHPRIAASAGLRFS